MFIKCLEDNKFIIIDSERFVFENNLKYLNFFYKSESSHLNLFSKFFFSFFYSTGLINVDFSINSFKMSKIRNFFMCVLFLEFLTSSLISFVKLKKFDKLSQKMLFQLKFKSNFYTTSDFAIHFLSLNYAFRNLLKKNSSLLYDFKEGVLGRTDLDYCFLLHLNSAFYLKDFLLFNFNFLNFITIKNCKIFAVKFIFFRNIYFGLNLTKKLFFDF